MEILQITSDYLPNPLWGMGWHVFQIVERLNGKNITTRVATASKSNGYHKNIITTDSSDDRELLSPNQYEIFHDFNRLNRGA